MDGSENSTARREQLLLKEYELCQDAAYKIEATIWQTSAVIGIGSVGSLVLLIRAQSPWLVACAVGVLVNATAFVWWHMACRWWSIQHAKLWRVRHVEERLVLYQTRYVDYLDAATECETKSVSVKELTHLAYQRTEDNETASENAQNPMKQRKLRKLRRLQDLIDKYLPDKRVAEDLEVLRKDYEHEGSKWHLGRFLVFSAVAWEVYLICLLLGPHLPWVVYVSDHFPKALQWILPH